MSKGLRVQLVAQKVIFVHHQLFKTPALDYRISPLRLHRILYFLQFSHITLYGKLLFDETFLAYPTGPALEKINQAFKQFGDNQEIPPNFGYNVAFDRETDGLIFAVVKKMRNYSTQTLSKMTQAHRPYTKGYEKSFGLGDITIDNEELFLFAKEQKENAVDKKEDEEEKTITVEE